jgi:hypothetical protein
MSINDKLRAWVNPPTPHATAEETATRALLEAQLDAISRGLTPVLGTSIFDTTANTSAPSTVGYIGSGGGGGGSVHTAIDRRVEVGYGFTASQRIADERMIYMRLHVLDGAAKLFDFLTTHRITENKVAVFVCNNGSYVVLEDNTDLFPSDTLITQLRMIKK